MDYTEEHLKKCGLATIEELYYNQYDENRDIPAIDMIKEEQSPGKWDLIYQIYCYGNSTKYLCRVFDCEGRLK